MTVGCGAVLRMVDFRARRMGAGIVGTERGKAAVDLPRGGPCGGARGEEAGVVDVL